LAGTARSAAGAFFLAVGIGANALDELHGRPLGTGLSDRTLVALAAVGSVARSGSAWPVWRAVSPYPSSKPTEGAYAHTTPPRPGVIAKTCPFVTQVGRGDEDSAARAEPATSVTETPIGATASAASRSEANPGPVDRGRTRRPRRPAARNSRP
jgi:hypothetical protein